MTASTNPARLAVILARGGSKRLPGKNLRLLSGKPLIAWAIEAARSSGCFEKVLVSTDCGTIAREAKKRGAWVPFVRPDDLASDHASSLDALVHAVRWVIENPCGIPAPELVALLQPTTPFVTATYVKEAVTLFEEQGFHSLSSMCPVHERPEWMFRCEPSGAAVPVDPQGVVRPSHVLPPLFRENGALYLIRSSVLLEKHSLYDFSHHGAYLMPVADSIDIDEPSDWEMAEAVMAVRRKTRP